MVYNVALLRARLSLPYSLLLLRPLLPPPDTLLSHPLSFTFIFTFSMKFATILSVATLVSTATAFPWMAAEIQGEKREMGPRGLFSNSDVTKLVRLVRNLQPGLLANLSSQIKEGMEQVNSQISAAGIEIPKSNILDKDWSSITAQDIQAAYGLPDYGNANASTHERRGLKLWGVAEDDAHPWQAPGPGDLRGPCPGLNTAANHGYLPRSGVVNPIQLFVGAFQALSLSPDLCAVLATLSFLFKGDLTTLTLSIGTRNGLGGGLGDHGVLEGDASVTRDDAYFGNGWSPVRSKIELLKQEMIQYGGGEITPYQLAKSRKRAFDDSRENNPNFDFNPWRMLVAYGESGFVMRALRGDLLHFGVDDIHSWFVTERFPPGWSRSPIPITIPEILAWAAVIELLDPTIPGYTILGVYTGDVTSWLNIGGWFTKGSGASTIAGVGCGVANIFLSWFPNTISNLFGDLGLGSLNGLSC
jgi:hypothetical protein